jgi:hypothetical protein
VRYFATVEKEVLHQRLLAEVRATPGQRVGWYAARLRIDPRDASTALVELRKLGVIQLHGHKNQGRYYPDGLSAPKTEEEPRQNYPLDYGEGPSASDLVGELAKIDELLDTFRVPLLPTRIARLAFLAGLSRGKA